MNKMSIKEVLIRLFVSAVLLTINYFISLFEISVLNGSLIFRFTYLINMLYAVYFDVRWCVGFGLIGDILPFIFSDPGYSFFPGYSISAVLTCMLYRYFFYNHKSISIIDTIRCKLCVNMLINIVLGALWRYMIFGNNAYYYGASLLKNLILAPIEGTCFYGLYRLAELIRSKLNYEG